MIFYKGVNVTDLRDNYIPGTVAIDFMTAYMWMARIQSNKRRGGKTRHVRHGKACIIEINYEGDLLSHTEFQRMGVSEHSRLSCWTSAVKDKAQLNIPCPYRVLSDTEIHQLFTF